MSVSKTALKNLIALTKGEKLPASVLKDAVSQDLINEEILLIEVHGSRKRYYAKDGDKLRNYLSCTYPELQDMEAYLAILEEPDKVNRAQLTAVTGDSKTKKHRTCEGFLVNSYSPIPATLCGKDIVISPDEGSYVFIANPESFCIPKNVIVVGIENMENFYEIRSQKYLFDNYVATEGQPILFVSRYPQRESKDLQKWLERIPNPYVHFGDFDPAGIRIYQTEFMPYISQNRCTLLIPDDIEVKIQNGSTNRYNSQISILNNLELSDTRLSSLLDLIKKYHKCIDQEIYIK